MYHFLPVWQHRVTGSPGRQSFSSAVSHLGVHFWKIRRACLIMSTSICPTDITEKKDSEGEFCE